MSRSGRSRAAVVIAICLALSAGSVPPAASQAAPKTPASLDTPSFSPVGPMSSPRFSQTATLLQNGKILIAGGRSAADNFASTNTAELFDPASGAFKALAPMTVERQQHTATLLPNGMVLIAGGSTPQGTTSMVELFDPATETFAPLTPMTTARYGHTATLLPSGEVLVAGGWTSAGATKKTELFDPASGTFTALPPMTKERLRHTGVVLRDGKVLLAGGSFGLGSTDTAELFDPTAGTFTALPPMNSVRDEHTATLLPDGKVLLAGGRTDTGVTTNTTELFDPATGAFTLSAPLVSARQAHTATLLPSGGVLIAGGEQFGNPSAWTTAEVWDPTTGTSSPLASTMATGRRHHAATLLPSGQVLLAGGYGGNDPTTGAYRPVTNTADLFDPASGSFTPLFPNTMTIGRRGHTATPLPNGQVLIAGGQTTEDFNTDSAELFDPVAGTFSPLSASMTERRAWHTATLLPSGKVLLAGGFGFANSNTAELFDPASGTFTPVVDTMSVGHNLHTATLLADGRVLIVGGRSESGVTDTAELFDPATGTFTLLPRLDSKLVDHTATLLPNGMVLIAGGIPGFAVLGERPTINAELFNPASETFTTLDPMNSSRANHTATLLPSGKVLVTGGDTGTRRSDTAEVFDPASKTFTSLPNNMTSERYFHLATLLQDGTVLVTGGNTAEIFDPATGNFTSLPPMSADRIFSTATLLPSGKVLLAGGPEPAGNSSSGSNTAELYDSGFGFSDARRPVISAIPDLLMQPASVAVTGSGFRGDSSASGGSYSSSATDYPLLQLSRVDNGQTFFPLTDPTTNWSDTTFSSAIVGTPDPLPAGHYKATIFANGIPSRPRSIVIPNGFTPEPDPTPTGEPTSTATPSATPPSSGQRGSYPSTPSDPHFGVTPEATDFFIANQWALKKIEAPAAWQQSRATGFRIKVAVLDSGVDLQHADLQCPGKLEVVTDSDPVGGDSNPDDENGHGTHVAGIIGACTNNGTGIAGVAPDATIMPIRVLNAAGSGTEAGLITGLNKAVASGAHVVNMSLSFQPGVSQVTDFSGIDSALEAAAAQGVVVVAAAGNDGFPLCNYPALAENVVCVGATDPRDLKSWYSNFPVKATGAALVAPGGTSPTAFCDMHSESILSLFPRELDGCDEGLPGYRSFEGTSMASPHVAGVAALVYDRLGPERSASRAQAVIDAIVTEADDLGVPGYDPLFGSGRVNALAAVCSVGPSCGVDPDPSESPTTDPSESPTTDPSESPTTDPSESPTTDPSESPTDDPSESPTDDPSESPTPTDEPSESPTPTDEPTQGPGPVAPAAPSNLTASAASATRVQLGWSDNSNNETSFAIERSSGGKDWREVATSAPNQTSYVDTTVEPNTNYSYRVRAYNSVGHSEYSNVAAATTPASSSGETSARAPAAPTNLTGSALSSSRIELGWTDGSGNEDGFAIERSGSDGVWQEIATTGRNQTTYVDSGLAPSTGYRYRVRAYNSIGHSTYSNVAETTTQKAPANGGSGEPSPEPSETSEPVKPVAVGSATTSLAASRELIAFKKGVELSGVVERDDNCTGPLEIEVSRRLHGTNSYKSLGSTPVNGSGAWGLQVKGKRNAAYVAQVKKTDTCQGEASVPKDVLVRAKIAVRIPKRCGGPIRGRVRPVNEGEVVLQRRAKGRWNEVAMSKLNDRARFALKAKRCGKHRLVWAEDGAPNESAKKRFRI